jgi:hypothetical protein
MYRELQPLRQALGAELKAHLSPVEPGTDPEHLLQSYLDRLTVCVGSDVADQTITCFAVDAIGDKLGHLLDALNDPLGSEGAWESLEELCAQHGMRIILLAMETSGVYYWAWWDFLAGRSNLARVLHNPRTTEHMTEVLSKKVRNELVDAYALAEQVRLGSTPEVVLSEDPDLLAARFCSRTARDLAQQINRKKSQLRSLLRACTPALGQVFPKAKFHHPAVYALLLDYLFPDEFAAAGVEAITVILQDHCRTAFSRDHAEQLISLCRRTLTREIGREVIRQWVHHLIEDISTCQKRKRYTLPRQATA